jgi:DNA-binding transcriptional ArsR family regulator
MSALAELLSSRVRSEVFRILFGVNQLELHGRELARRSGFSEATLRQELRKLRRLDLVTARRAGNRVYFRANQEHPLYRELHSLVLKTNGLADVITSALENAEVDVAFVFGSMVEGDATGTSDVDLMVVSTLSLRELSNVLFGAAESIGREINIHVMPSAEYRKRLTQGDHFVTHVLGGPKLFIVGSERDLEAMA